MTELPSGPAPAQPSVRLDKWLWAARFFKSRSQATVACGAGHVKIEGVAAKAARGVRGGERIEVVTPGGVRIVEVRALAERRGPAPAARELYVDHTPPPAPDADLFARLPPARARGAGRPTKRDRRTIDRLRDDDAF
ncbi:MAG: RNA-binding S4 domain-containing protein [Polyangiaceae bacterium]|nr:RNA-binding S4 domain-containing protein [Polyangiaceae bacterium]